MKQCSRQTTRLYTHEVRVWTASGVRVRPPAAAHRVRVDIVQFVADVAAEAGRGQVEDADSQRLEQEIVEIARSLVVAQNVVLGSRRDRRCRHGAQCTHRQICTAVTFTIITIIKSTSELRNVSVT